MGTVLGSRCEGGCAMESRVKLFGHPLHPMLVVFPFGLFVTAAGLDLVYRWTTVPALPGVAQLNIQIGLVVGLIAAVVGWIDWFAIPAGTRAKKIGLLHGASNMIAVALFG